MNETNHLSISDLLVTTGISCPYCWENIEIQVDKINLPTQYIEDCQVCCQPIFISHTLDQNDEIDTIVEREND